MRNRRRIGIGATGVVLLMCLGYGAGIVVAQQPPLPEGCVGIIHTDSLQGAVNKVSGFVSQVNPMFGQMVPMLVPKLLGAQMTNGINMMGSFDAVILDPEKYTPSPLVRVIAITDQAMALQSFGATGRAEGEQEGIHTFAVLDQARFMAATPEEKQKLDQFIQKRFYLAFAGNSAVLADSKEACAAVKSMLAAGTLKPAEAVATKGDIAFKLDIKKLMLIYGEQIEQKIAPIKAAMRQGIQATQGQGMDPQTTAGLLNAYVDAVVDAIKQLDALELAVAFGEDGLRLRGSLSAKPDTKIGAILSQQKAGGSDLLKFIPSDSFLAASLNVQMTEEIKQGLVDLTQTLLKAAQTPVPPEQQEKMIQSVRDSMGFFGGQMAMGLVASGDEQKGGLTIVEVFTVSDPATAQKQMLKQFDQSAVFMGIYKNVMGLNIELAVTENAAKHQDVSISEVAILFDPATFPAEARQALQKIYGDPMILRAAVVDKCGIIAFGQDSLARIKQTIEFVKAGGGGDLQAQPEFISGTKGFPKETSLLLTLNPREIARFVGGITPPAGAPAGAQGAKAETALKGGVGVYLLAKGNALQGELYLSQEFIESLKTFVAMQMGAGPGAMPPPAPAAPPAPK